MPYHIIGMADTSGAFDQWLATSRDARVPFLIKTPDARFPQGEFPHHGGHGLGTTAHEPPHLAPTETAQLEQWQVVALEPGVYFPGRIGARVEELYLVTDAGGVELRTAFGRCRGLAGTR